MKNTIAVNLFIFALSLYLITASTDQIRSMDQSALRYEVTASIVEKHGLAVADGKGVRGKDGRYYSYYGLGWSVLALPFYAFGKLIGGSSEKYVYIMHLLAGAITVSVVFLFCVSLGYSNRSSLLAAVFYGFGSMAWPLAKQPFDHVGETLFILLSVYSLYLYTVQYRIKFIILSAVFFGISLNIRLTSILVGPSLLLIAIGAGMKERSLRNSKSKLFHHMVIFMVVLIPFIVAILWYNSYRFGSMYETGFQLIADKTGLDFFSGTQLLTGLQGLLLSPGKGIFYYSPVALLFFPAIIPFYNRHRILAASFVTVSISYLLFMSKNIYWHGDWAWGPRYLLAILPFLIIPAVALLEKHNNGSKPFLWKTTIYGIFVVGFVIQVAAVSVNYYNYFLNLQVEKKVSFNVIQGIGVPDIIEPPPEVHFNWSMSPIMAQFQFLKDISHRIKDYENIKVPADAPLSERIKSYPQINIYDFWWAYLYYVYGVRTGFFIVAALCGVCAISGYRMVRITCRRL
ncbi:MAG TPA: glycosyltransferase family 39 protein [Terriglobales bacterium]|nr:glycosyltransferase family 39 protein [Terriglobales bacterium]